MWDDIGPEGKGAYKSRTEQAKKVYLRQLETYRVALVSKANTSLESPYNVKVLADGIKDGDDLMNQRFVP